jgi:Flp pilus assembly protein TadD
VIGLVEAGEQARADRYTYLPQIGLYVLIAWGFTDLITSMIARRSSSRARFTGRQSPIRARKNPAGTPRAIGTKPGIGYRAFCAAVATAIVISLSRAAFVQTSYWRNTEALWNHALAVTSHNDVAHYNLGYFFLQHGDLDAAISRFETALQIRSRNSATHYNFGSAPIENNLANVLAQRGRLDEAVNHYHNAMRLRPGYGDPYLNLGNILFRQGRTQDALVLWHQAHATESEDARFHTTLADAFLRAGSEKDAVAEYEYAAGISAQDPLPRNNLAWLLATSSDAEIRNDSRAMELANEAVRLSNGKDPNCLRTLAAACAENGRFAEAQETARRALRAAEHVDNRSLASALRDELALYELGLPYQR